MRNFPLWTLRNDVNSILATLASHMFKKIQKAPNLHLQLAVAFKYFFARNCGKVSALHTLETRLVELKTNFFFYTCPVCAPDSAFSQQSTTLLLRWPRESRSSQATRKSNCNAPGLPRHCHCGRVRDKTSQEALAYLDTLQDALAFLPHVFKGTPLGKHQQMGEQLVQAVGGHGAGVMPVQRTVRGLWGEPEALGLPEDHLPDVLQGGLPGGGIPAAQPIPPHFILSLLHDDPDVGVFQLPFSMPPPPAPSPKKGHFAVPKWGTGGSKKQN